MCLECGKVCDSKVALRKHMGSHGKKQVCKGCNASFR
jgi:hypothetical protein